LTAAQILEVVHGLVQNMSVVTDGEQIYQACHSLGVDNRIILDGKVSLDCVRNALGMFLSSQRNIPASNRASETMNQIASDMNESKRQLMFTPAMADRSC
jgi:hypothetical protein